MSCGKPSHPDHGSTEGVLYDTIAHTDDKQQEEGERVSAGVKNSNNSKENLGANVRAVAVLVF